mmetsp:Transcript_18571/g.37545  ORF Transcript_18571/g.37545 Transcript_18571/m.37545 type:complete len:127 (-) Transcript_18571:93-473(-)
MEAEPAREQQDVPQQPAQEPAQEPAQAEEAPQPDTPLVQQAEQGEEQQQDVQEAEQKTPTQDTADSLIEDAFPSRVESAEAKTQQAEGSALCHTGVSAVVEGAMQSASTAAAKLEIDEDQQLQGHI